VVKRKEEEKASSLEEYESKCEHWGVERPNRDVDGRDLPYLHAGAAAASKQPLGTAGQPTRRGV